MESDKEIKAIADILASLEGLEAQAQERVFKYIIERLNISVSKPHSTAHSINPHPNSTETPTSSQLPSSNLTVKDIRALKEEKQPESAIQMAVLVAYYLQEIANHEERKDSINVEDIQKYFKQAGFALPKVPKSALLNSKAAGYLELAEDRGYYKLNPVGYNLVAYGLPAKNRSTNAKRPKAQAKKRVKGARNNPIPTEVKSDTVGNEVIASYVANLQSLLRQIKLSSVPHVNSEHLKNKIRENVKTYFGILRVNFMQNGIDTKSLDEQMQVLLSYANNRTRVSSYTPLLNSIEQGLRALEVQQLISESDNLVKAKNASLGITIIEQDKKIIEVLSKIVPTSAISYQQVLIDISQPRLSYKGTAGELREILREVLDHLAPDKEVLSSTGFKLEKDRTTPTMKQKVRFILKNRQKSQSAIEVPENATSIIEESIAKLARATYNRGSISTHTGAEKQEILNLKGIWIVYYAKY